MRSDRAVLRTWSIIATLLAVGSLDVLFARIEPAMILSVCRWEATDILVLSPTSNKGVFQVVETLKGDSNPGQTIVLTELTPPDDIAAFKEAAERNFTPPEPPPTMQPDDRMIVFLLRPGAKHEFFPPPSPQSTDCWQSANGFGDMRFSAVWLRNGEAFAMFQIGEDATSLKDLSLTEQELRHQIDVGIQLRASLDRALTCPVDSVGRAVQLAELVHADDPIAPSSALKYLATGGTAAADVLRELLSDPKLLNLHSEIVAALAKTGAGNAGLFQILGEETQYWSSACGSLKPGWGNGLAYSEHEKLNSHYKRALGTLKGIRELQSSEDRPEVRNFHEVWTKCPPIGENETQQSEISKECDLLLQPQAAGTQMPY